MDVTCSTCGEPWDTYHLRHDAIWDTSLGENEIQFWNSLSDDKRLGASLREAFRLAGWEFGNTVVNVIRCPVCPKGASPDWERVAAKATIEWRINFLSGIGMLAATS